MDARMPVTHEEGDRYPLAVPSRLAGDKRQRKETSLLHSSSVGSSERLLSVRSVDRAHPVEQRSFNGSVAETVPPILG